MATVGLTEEEKKILNEARTEPPKPWTVDKRGRDYPDRVIQWRHRPTGVFLYIKNLGGGTYRPIIDDSDADFELPDTVRRHLPGQQNKLGVAVGETMQWIETSDLKSLRG